MGSKSILILTDFFPPGFRSGGPARSCYNVCVGLSETVPVKVLTRDTDLGDTLPYPGIKPDTWRPFLPGVSVCYCSRNKQGIRSVLRYMRDSEAAVFYLNSMFSIPFTIYPLLLHWLGFIKGRMVLAPRGMLKPSALQYKFSKKKVFLALFKLLGWHKRILFHATSAEESKDIRHTLGPLTTVITCAPIPDIYLLQQRKEHIKYPFSINLCIVGRIHPIKNIHIALKALADTSFPSVKVEVIGPFEDQAYYELCESITSSLPTGVRVTFHGALPSEKIYPILQESDFFYLLTQGENFGHAIFEALALGKPVIISDQTPWRNLSSHYAGWDLSLNDPEKIQKTLSTAISMENDVYQIWSQGAYQCAKGFIEKSNLLQQYLELFGIENSKITHDDSL